MTSHLFDRINITTAYVLDQDEALDFYCGTLGFEVRDDVDLGFMRWLTIALPGQAHQVLLEVPGPPVHDEQPYGVDFGMRDPFGNHLRVAQLFAEQPEFTDKVKERWAGDAPVEA